jgi:hypothetical protein
VIVVDWSVAVTFVRWKCELLPFGLVTSEKINIFDLTRAKNNWPYVI